VLDPGNVSIDAWVWGMQEACSHLTEGFTDGRNVKEGYVRTLARVHGGMERLEKDTVRLGNNRTLG
jgi:hypothetical protein